MSSHLDPHTVNNTHTPIHTHTPVHTHPSTHTHTNTHTHPNTQTPIHTHTIQWSWPYGFHAVNGIPHFLWALYKLTWGLQEEILNIAGLAELPRTCPMRRHQNPGAPATSGTHVNGLRKQQVPLHANLSGADSEMNRKRRVNIGPKLLNLSREIGNNPIGLWTKTELCVAYKDPETDMLYFT